MTRTRCLLLAASLLLATPAVLADEPSGLIVAKEAFTFELPRVGGLVLPVLVDPPHRGDYLVPFLPSGDGFDPTQGGGLVPGDEGRSPRGPGSPLPGGPRVPEGRVPFFPDSEECEPADCDVAGVGLELGQCAIPFTLQEGVEGEGNVIGPVSFPEDYECQVAVLMLTAEWCGPCRAASAGLEEFLAGRDDEAVELVQVLFEDAAGELATLVAAERYTDDLDLTEPVLVDEGRSVFMTYDEHGAIPQVFVYGCDGLLQTKVLGWAQSAIEEAIEDALASCAGSV